MRPGKMSERRKRGRRSCVDEKEEARGEEELVRKEKRIEIVRKREEEKRETEGEELRWECGRKERQKVEDTEERKMRR